MYYPSGFFSGFCIYLRHMWLNLFHTWDIKIYKEILDILYDILEITYNTPVQNFKDEITWEFMTWNHWHIDRSCNHFHAQISINLKYLESKV